MAYYNPQTNSIGVNSSSGYQPWVSTATATNNAAPTYDFYSNSGSYTPYGYGTSYGSPTVDTSGLQNTARNLIGQIQSAYSSLEGKIAPVIQDKINQYLQTYDQQAQNLNKSFQNDIGQTQNIYGSRGLQDSSFLGNALDQNAQIYNQNLNAINQDKTNQLAALGSYAQGLQGQANTAAQQYAQYLPNLGQYSATDLGNLNSQLQSALPGIQNQVNGMGTNADFLNTLNKFAPNANTGSSQLAAKLQQLVTSSAPVFAKNQIAAGLIKSAQLQDQGAQNYWQNYYQNLLNGA